MSIVHKVQVLLKKLQNKDLTHQVQSDIADDINFRRNSVNLILGKRGSGKTFNSLREALKLNFVKNHGYKKLILVSDKSSDPTYDDVKDDLPMDSEVVKYADAVQVIKEIAEYKAALESIQNNPMIKSFEHISPESVEKLKEVLGEVSFKDKNVHTLVILDDCLNYFKKHNKSNKELFSLLFQNRQPKITYFLIMQDPLGLDTSIKQNLDTVWIFGGFTEKKFNYFLDYTPVDSKNGLYDAYKKLPSSEAMVFDIRPNGTVIKIVQYDGESQLFRQS